MCIAPRVTRSFPLPCIYRLSLITTLLTSMAPMSPNLDELWMNRGEDGTPGSRRGGRRIRRQLSRPTPTGTGFAASQRASSIASASPPSIPSMTWLYTSRVMFYAGEPEKLLDVLVMLARHSEYCSASVSKIVQADSEQSRPLRNHAGCWIRTSENSILLCSSVNKPSSRDFAGRKEGPRSLADPGPFSNRRLPRTLPSISLGDVSCSRLEQPPHP